MRDKYFYRNSFLFFISLFVFSVACEPEKSREEMILGEWTAHWETKADESFSDISGENLQMDGVITFSKDGTVEISAFGFEGCIFFKDTVKNVLNWKLAGAELKFIDKGEDGLPYTINKFNPNELHLTLLEDINLTLRKN